MRCINCMREVKDSGVCPHCGFDAATYKPPDNALPPDSVLNGGKYVVGRVLGRGGFGITYVALDRNLGLRVAIKECLPQRDARRDADGVSAQWLVPVHEQERARDSFLREAKKMAEIYGIPGVVPVREYFDDNKTTYIVMDYVEGETLAQRLRRTGSWSARECFRLLSPVMDTLAQAHKLQIEGEDRVGVIHRDIKPNNIIIGRIKGGKERVWLLDLGAAKDLGARDFAPNVSVESRPVGTPGYAPPEQGTNKGSIGPWTDVYAMSATFIYCMTGKKPPDSQSRSSELREPEVLLSVPGAVGDVLRKGMALHREERYQTMKELRDALEKALPKPKPKRPKWIPALVALLAVAVLIPLALIAIHPKPEIVASGECGENALWMLNKDGVLTISGTGDIVKSDYGNSPWSKYQDMISYVKILQGITNIGEYAFSACKNLQSVTIPNSVTEIGTAAFSDCNVLQSVTIPNSVTKIDSHVFSDCSALTSVEISNSVTEIGQAVFWGCSALTSLQIPNSVTEIGMSAFSGCSALTSVEISNSVTEIHSGVFSGCSALTSVQIPNSVIKIYALAFYNCSALISVEIPDSVTDIYTSAFCCCTSLSSVSVPAGATIADDAFDENTVVRRRTEYESLKQAVEQELVSSAPKYYA